MKFKKLVNSAIALTIATMLSSANLAVAIPIGNDIEYIPFPRNLGVGNDHPDRKLVVNGQALISGDGVPGNDDLLVEGQIKITGGNPVLGRVLTTDAAGLASWQPIVVNNTTITNSNITGGIINGAQLISQDDLRVVDDGTFGDTVTARAFIGQVFNGGVFRGDGSGLTSIPAGSITGTLRPNALFITGSSIPEAQVLADGSLGILTGNDVIFQGVGSDAGDIVFVNGTGNEKARIYSDTNAKNGLALSVGTTSPEVFLNEFGNLGVNTLTPTEKLEVGGNVKAVRFIGDGSGLTNIAATTINNTTINNVISQNGKLINGDIFQSNITNSTIVNSNVTGGIINGTELISQNDLRVVDDGTFGDTVTARAFIGQVFNGGIFRGTFTGTHTGDGSGLTGISATTVAPGTTINNPNINNATITNSTFTGGTITNANLTGGIINGAQLISQDDLRVRDDATIVDDLTVGDTVTARAFIGQVFNGGTFRGTHTGTFTGDGSGLTSIPATAIVGSPDSKPSALFIAGSSTPEEQVLADGSLGILSGNDVVFHGVGSDAGDIVFVNGTGNEKARIYSDTNAKNGLGLSVGTASPEVYLNEFGNLGVNTLTPTEKLEVGGNVKAVRFIGDGSGLTGISATTVAPGTTINNPNINNATITNSTFTGGTITNTNHTGGTLSGTHQGDGSGLTNIQASAIVGAPDVKPSALFIAGSSTPEAQILGDGSLSVLAGNDVVFQGNGPDSGDLIFTNAAGTEKARIFADPAAKDGLAFSVGGSAPEVYLDAVGNLGINKVAPEHRLHVGGDVKADNFIGEGSGLRNIPATAITGTIDAKPSALFIAGSSTPEAQILGDGSLSVLAGNDVVFHGVGSDAGDIVFVNGTGNEKARIYSDTNAKNGLALSVGAASPEVYLNEFGNLGVNTLIPREKLEVGGNVRAVKFLGDGSELEHITATTLANNSTINNATINNSNITGGVINGTTLISQNDLNVIDDGTFGDTVKARAFIGQVFNGGNFTGDGSGLRNIPSTAITGTIDAKPSALFIAGSSTPEAQILGDGSLSVLAGNDVVFQGNGPDSGDLIFTNAAGTEKARIFADPAAKDGLAFSVGGSAPEVYLDAVGNLGINNVAPEQRLHVGGNVKADQFMGKFMGDGSGLNNIPATAITGTIDAKPSALFITGSSTPEAQILGDGSLSVLAGNDVVFQGNGPDSGDLIFTNAAGTEKARIFADPAAKDGLAFSVGGSAPEVYLDAVGNLGINKVAPEHKLDVGGNVHAEQFIGDGSRLTNIQASAITGTIDAKQSALYPVGSSTPLVQVIGASSLGVLSGHDVVFQGVGSDAGDIVFVNGTGNEKARIYSDTNAKNGLALSVGAASPEVYLNEFGNLGVNTLIPREKLEVGGNVRAVKFLGDGSELEHITATTLANNSTINNATINNSNITGGIINGTTLISQDDLRVMDDVTVRDTVTARAFIGQVFNGGVFNGTHLGTFSGNGYHIRNIQGVSIVGNVRQSELYKSGPLNPSELPSAQMTNVGDLTMLSGNNIIMQAPTTEGVDAGDLIFLDGRGEEKARIYSEPNAGNGLAFSVNMASNNPEMYLSSTGNVGINTATPRQKLEVAGNVQAQKFMGDGSELTGITLANLAPGSTVTNTNVVGTTNISGVIVGNAQIHGAPPIRKVSATGGSGAGSTVRSIATCAADEYVVGGGAKCDLITSDGVVGYLKENYPNDNNGWTGMCTYQAITVTTYALCAKKYIQVTP